MVSKPTGRPRGRPRKERPPSLSAEEKLLRKFLRDPDRLSIALMDALLELGAGERACAMAIAVLMLGVEGDLPRNNSEGLIVTNWEKEKTKKGASAGTPEGRASTLRVKQDRCRSTGEAIWRGHMAGAFMAVLRPSGDPETAKAAVVERVILSGEPYFEHVILILWRLIDAKLPLLPEFPANTVSTT